MRKVNCESQGLSLNDLRSMGNTFYLRVNLSDQRGARRYEGKGQEVTGHHNVVYWYSGRP